MHQFSLFFLICPKISRRFHFPALERSIIQSKGRTARMTASRTVRMNKWRVVGDSRPLKTRNNPILKSKIIVFIELKVVK